MSKPPLEDLFNYREARRNRKSLLLIFGIQMLISIALVAIILLLSPYLNDVMRGIVGIVVLLIAVPTVIAQFVAMAQRCRDMNIPGWLVVLNFVPFVSIAFQIILLVYPGTRGPNKYGPDPTGRPPVTANTDKVPT